MSEIKSVKWAEGFHARVNAREAYEYLEKVRQRNGGDLTAELVVEAARDPKSPIHDQIFDCLDEEAAERYRLWQANSMIRCFRVTYAEAEDTPVRGYVVVTRDGRRGNYRATNEALRHESYRDNVLQQALAELQSFRRKYADLKELSVVLNAVEEVLEREA